MKRLIVPKQLEMATCRTWMLWKKLLMKALMMTWTTIGMMLNHLNWTYWRLSKKFLIQSTSQSVAIFSTGKALTVDELLVKFRGRCRFRVYMKSKPCRYGLKIWSAVDAVTRYILNLQVKLFLQLLQLLCPVFLLYSLSSLSFLCLFTRSTRGSKEKPKNVIKAGESSWTWWNLFWTADMK